MNEFRPGWQSGKIEQSATLELAEVFRSGSDLEACSRALAMINQEIDPRCLWDAAFNFSGELLRRHPGIVSLHAITTSNALHFAYQNCGNEETRKFLLLQTCAFMPLFRGDIVSQNQDRFDQLQPEPVSDQATIAIDDIFATIDSDKAKAASKVFHFLQTGHSPKKLIDTARRFLFLKGNNTHDYKFASAVLEDFYQVSPQWRHHYLAASVYHLRGSKAPTSNLVPRIQGALG